MISSLLKIKSQAQECAQLIQEAHSISVLTGAGISTNAGIPDFRGPRGLYVTRRYDPEKIFEMCPFRRCRQFYVQRDFNRGVGCLIVLVGILLVPKTYGLSLPVFALIDWLCYRRVQAMVICYRCGAEYRGFAIPPRFKSYMHHIGLRYDKYR